MGPNDAHPEYSQLRAAPKNPNIQPETPRVSFFRPKQCMCPRCGRCTVQLGAALITSIYTTATALIPHLYNKYPFCFVQYNQLNKSLSSFKGSCCCCCCFFFKLQDKAKGCLCPFFIKANYSLCIVYRHSTNVQLLLTQT